MTAGEKRCFHELVDKDKELIVGNGCGAGCSKEPLGLRKKMRKEEVQGIDWKA